MGCTSSKERKRREEADVYYDRLYASQNQRSPPPQPADPPSPQPATPSSAADTPQETVVPEHCSPRKSLCALSPSPTLTMVPTSDSAQLRRRRSSAYGALGPRRPSHLVPPKPTINGKPLKLAGPSMAYKTARPLFGAKCYELITEEGARCYYNDTIDHVLVAKAELDAGAVFDRLGGEFTIDAAPKAKGGICFEAHIGPGEARPLLKYELGSLSISFALGGLTPEYCARCTADSTRAVAEATAAVAAVAATVAPVACTLSAGAQADAEDRAVAAACAEAGVLFVDRRFPPESKSVGDGVLEPGLELAWRRPADYLATAAQRSLAVPTVDVHPNCIMQGQLGDCYFCCAMSALAEFPARVEALFPVFDHLRLRDGSNGAHIVRLCVAGLWRDIVVDDHLPCAGAGPAFARNATLPRELWPALLEKAYAKATAGSYAGIVGGDTTWALTTLTGFPVERFDKPWSEARASEAAAAELFGRLARWDGEDFLVTLGTPSCSGKRAAKLRAEGLVEGHAFSCLRAVAAGGRRLLQVRNPWGEDEWNGDWGDDSPLWEAHPEVADACGFTGPCADGTFWIAIEDALTRFEGGAVCFSREDWHELRSPMTIAGGAIAETVFEVTPEVPMELYLSLVQPTLDPAQCAAVAWSVFRSDGNGGLIRIAGSTQDFETTSAADSLCFVQGSNVAVRYTLPPLPSDVQAAHDGPAYVLVPTRNAARPEPCPLVATFHCPVLLRDSDGGGCSAITAKRLPKTHPLVDGGDLASRCPYDAAAVPVSPLPWQFFCDGEIVEVESSE